MTILERAIKVYGEEHQLTVTIEELSELTKEICKYRRGIGNRDALIEELADCYIVLEQIELIFNITSEELHNITIKKLNRLEERIDTHKGQQTDLTNKCGSCRWSVPCKFSEKSVLGCYVECQNPHKVWRHEISKKRQRTTHKCRYYEKRF